MPWVPKKAEGTEEAAEAPVKEESAPSRAKGKKRVEKEDQDWTTLAAVGPAQVAKGGEGKVGKKGGKGEKKGGKEKGKGKGEEAFAKEKRTARPEPEAPKDYGPQASKNRGKDGKKGKGKGAAKGKLVEDAERPERSKQRKDDSRRQASAFDGEFCTVRKHSSMGCAIVSMNDWRVRQAILNFGAELTISGLKVQLKPQVDKESKEQVMTDLFVGWGRQTEKTNPLGEEELADFFDSKHEELIKSPTLDQLASAGGEDQKRAMAKHMNAMQGKWAQEGAQAQKTQAPQPVQAQMPPAPPPQPALPPGAIPGAPPAYPPAVRQAMPQNAAQLQAQQQAQWAAMQAQYVRYQQQYYAQVAAQQQAQQAQQAAYAEHLRAAELAQREAQEASQRQAAQKAKGFKASYRVPTDEEVRAKLLALQGKKATEEENTPAEQIANPEANPEVAPAPNEEAPVPAPAAEKE